MLNFCDGHNEPDSTIARWSSEGWKRSNCQQNMFCFFHTNNQLINLHLQPVAPHFPQDEEDLVEPVILSTEILNYFGTQWSCFNHGMKKGVCANAISDAARYQNVVLHGDQWEEYGRLALAKFDADGENSDKIADKLHRHARVDADLNAFNGFPCYESPPPPPKKANGDSPVAASFAAASNVKID
jgi:hypothetical protein